MRFTLPLVLSLALLLGRTALAQQPHPAGDSAVVAALLSALRDTSPAVEATAIAQLRRSGTSLLPAIDAQFHGRDARGHYTAALALVLVGPPALPYIRAALADTSGRNFIMQNALQDAPAPDADVLLLLHPLLTDASVDVRLRAVEALDAASRSDPRIGVLLVRALGDTVPKIRAAAAYGLIHVSDSASRVTGTLALLGLLEDSSVVVRRGAVYALGNMRTSASQTVPRLVTRMQRDADTEVRWLSARVLGWFSLDASSAVPSLLSALEDTLPQVRSEALTALGNIGVRRLPPPLAAASLTAIARHVGAATPAMRLAAVEALAAIGVPAVSPLATALTSPDSSVAVTAARALGQLPDERRIVAPLLRALSDPRPAMRAEAASALGGIGESVLVSLRRVQRVGTVPSRVAAARALHHHRIATALPVARRCYRIEYGPLSTSLREGKVEGVRPPSRVRFSTVRARRSPRPDTLAFLIEQRGSEGAWMPTGYWVPRLGSQTVDLDPWPSLSGVRLSLQTGAGPRLRGTMRTYWDFDHPDETAEVVAHPIACTLPRGRP